MAMSMPMPVPFQFVNIRMPTQQGHHEGPPPYFIPAPGPQLPYVPREEVFHGETDSVSSQEMDSQNSQSSMGSFVLCYVPSGMTVADALAIAPGVQTQVLGSGYLNVNGPHQLGSSSPTKPPAQLPAIEQSAGRVQENGSEYHQTPGPSHQATNNGMTPRLLLPPPAAAPGMLMQIQPGFGPDHQNNNHAPNGVVPVRPMLLPQNGQQVVYCQPFVMQMQNPGKANNGTMNNPAFNPEAPSFYPSSHRVEQNQAVAYTPGDGYIPQGEVQMNPAPMCNPFPVQPMFCPTNANGVGMYTQY